MKAPAFWWRENRAAATLLTPLEAVYRAVADERLRREGPHAPIPVVCLGNLTVGGAGKTPAAMATARLLGGAGERPIFLSRGYGARMAGPVRVDLKYHRAVDVGDEPLLLARRYPTIVARDRLAGAESAAKTGASVVVMDDGFQNPSVAKDCSVLVVDAGRGIGNRHVFPAGPLRAGLKAQLERAHALLVVGGGDGARDVVAAASSRGIPIFSGRVEPHRGVVAQLRGTPVLAFAGIAAPEKFFGTLAECGIDVRAHYAFADHHRFTDAEAKRLVDEAERNNLTAVTTEKDFVRLAGGGAAAALRRRTVALPVKLEIDDEATYRDFILGHIKPVAAAHAHAGSP